MFDSIFKLFFCLFLSVFAGTNLFSQTASPSEYPYVSPTAAASGMTSGLENGTTAETLHMMQVRAAARDSDRLAAAAAIAEQASRAIDEQDQEERLAKIRYRRQLKHEEAEKLKWQRASAANAFEKVSQVELNSWRSAQSGVSTQGGVRAGGDIPPEYMQIIQQQEASEAVRISAERRTAFSPIKKIVKRVDKSAEESAVETGLVGGRPLPRVESQSLPSTFVTNPLTQPERPKVLKFKAPKLNLSKIGSNRDDRLQAPPQQQPSLGSGSSPAPSASQPPAVVGKKPEPVSSGSASSPVLSASPARPASIPARSAADLIGQKRKPLFSSKNRSESQASNQQPMFGFNRKTAKLKTDPSEVDAGLFPAIGRQAPEFSQKKKFSLPKTTASSGSKLKKFNGSEVPTGTTVNRNGNSFYVVNSNSQFLRQKGEGSNSVTAVGPGTVVRMTKSGAEWASVTLKDGSQGVIQTKHLKAANSGGF